MNLDLCLILSVMQTLILHLVVKCHVSSGPHGPIFILIMQQIRRFRNRVWNRDSKGLILNHNISHTMYCNMAKLTGIDLLLGSGAVFVESLTNTMTSTKRKNLPFLSVSLDYLKVNLVPIRNFNVKVFSVDELNYRTVCINTFRKCILTFLRIKSNVTRCILIELFSVRQR